MWIGRDNTMQARNTVKVDYLVLTVPLTSLTDEEADMFARLSIEGEFRKMYGYRGLLYDKVFVGDNGERMLLQATGQRANDMLAYVNKRWNGISVARIDLQITVYVADADSVIRGIMPPKPYKSVRLINLNERGSTIYVGAPKSRCRLRIYNKSAELGEDRVNEQEKLRIELQLRDDYADRALVNVLSGTGDAFFRYYVFKMSDAYVTSIVDRACANSNLLAMTEVNSIKSEDGRREWLEHSVMPALTKLSIADPSYFRDFVDRLRKLLD
jgi:hypothetical protein